uniref:Uncharacterized protein n=1 Tax=Anopheles coluzzii TaxID=1518534 RepID=A0A8W7PH14_ANOCL
MEDTGSTAATSWPEARCTGECIIHSNHFDPHSLIFLDPNRVTGLEYWSESALQERGCKISCLAPHNTNVKWSSREGVGSVGRVSSDTLNERVGMAAWWRGKQPFRCQGDCNGCEQTEDSGNRRPVKG